MKRIIPGAKPDTCKPKIDYPCRWQYKIIGESRAEIRKLVEAHVRDETLELTESNVSSGGRYVSMNLEVTVHTDEQRLALYAHLAAHPSVKVVL